MQNNDDINNKSQACLCARYHGGTRARAHTHTQARTHARTHERTHAHTHTRLGDVRSVAMGNDRL